MVYHGIDAQDMVDRGQQVVSEAWGELLVKSFQLLQMLKFLDFVNLLKNHYRIINTVKRNVSGSNDNIDIGGDNVVSIEIVLRQIILLVNVQTIDHINNDFFQMLWWLIKCDGLFV